MSGPPVITDGIATVAQNPLQGPQLAQDGTRDIPFWDPSPTETAGQGGANQGDPIFFGQGDTYQTGWDLVWIAGEKLPGRCDVKVEPQVQIDQKKGPGHDGARLTLHGYLPGPIEISTLIWTELQWQAFGRLLPKFWRKPLKDPADIALVQKVQKVSAREASLLQAAVFVDHPWLRRFEIGAVIVRGITMENGEVPQSKLIRIKCIEYQPPTQRSSPRKVRAPAVKVDPRVDKPAPTPAQTGSGPTL